MDGLINFTGSLAGNIDEGGGGGVTPHVTATASVNDQTGVPGVTVVRSGTDAAPNFDFNFVNLKGADGTPGAQGPQGLTGATGPAGAQGPRGFTGATGATGPAGADGYSPAVSVTDIPGGHRVTITDETHPLGISFDVMDGIDGQDGSPGPQGPQGQPGAGVPEGGTVGQILTKASAVDYDSEWMDNEAVAVDYDNTQSGLAADNVQAAVDEINASLTNKLTHVVSRTRLTSNLTTTTKADLDSITINKKSNADLLVFISYIMSTSRYTSGIELYADDSFQASAMISETSPVSLNTWFVVSGLSAGQHTLKTKLFAQDSGTTATCYGYNANTIMALEL